MILPKGQICEALLITPTPLLNLNKETVKAIRDAKAHERELQRDFNFYTQSHLRGETTEDRVVRQLESESMAEAGVEVISEEAAKLGNVHQLTRLDRPKKLRSVREEITGDDIAAASSDISIFEQLECGHVKEFDSDV